LEKLSTNDNSDNNVESILEKLLEVPSDSLTNVHVKNTFLDLLSRTPNINLLVIKCIAEVTKNAEQRSKFSSGDILEKLMEMLDNSLREHNIELTCQLCRALGNIFYSNDDARNIIFHHDGGLILVNLFNVSNDQIKSSDELQNFSKVRSGVTSNYLLGNEELSQKAIELKIIEKIHARIEDALNPYNDALLEHLLPILSILLEQVSDLTFNHETLKCIVRILKQSTNSDVVDACLELLQCQAESDEIKLLLAKEGLCEHIFESMEKYKSFNGNVEINSLIKLSCDLIVLILTGGKKFSVTRLKINIILLLLFHRRSHALFEQHTSPFADGKVARFER
jgi:hypothetical protein